MVIPEGATRISEKILSMPWDSRIIRLSQVESPSFCFELQKQYVLEPKINLYFVNSSSRLVFID